MREIAGEVLPLIFWAVAFSVAVIVISLVAIVVIQVKLYDKAMKQSEIEKP